MSAGRAAVARLPAWSWAFVTFRIGDGASHALLLLAVVLTYGLPVWAVAATSALLNLVSIPATFLWAKAMDGGRGRRRIAVVGFAVSAVAMLVAALEPGFLLYLVAIVVYTVFGVATGPAASTLVLEGVPRSKWSVVTGALSRRTSIGHLVGLAAVVAVGLAGRLDVSNVFLITAAVSALAAVVAVLTVPGFDPATAPPRRFEMATLRTPGRLERIVFSPFRLLNRPTWRGVRRALHGPGGRLLWAVAAIFAGSLLFFASYPGVLVQQLGLTAGMALMAQTPSHITTLLTYPAAGRLGDNVGWTKAFNLGAGLRIIAMPGIALSILFWEQLGLWTLLAFHGLVGVAFALLQVNGPCLTASMHPDGRGQGVGAYHAAVATGTLVGSAGAFALALVAPLWVAYAGAVALTAVGGVLAAGTRLTPAPDAP